MTILTVANLLLAAFLGYLIGRWSDNYLNFWLKDPIWAPHHWIYGFILMIIGPVFFGEFGLRLFSFGLGLLISDLKDFWKLKFFSRDGKTKESRKFWHID